MTHGCERPVRTLRSNERARGGIWIDRPDSWPRADVADDANSPRLWAHSRAKAMLVQAHADVNWVGAQRLEAIGDRCLMRIECLMHGKHAQTRGRAVQTQMPVRMCCDELVDAVPRSYFRVSVEPKKEMVKSGRYGTAQQRRQHSYGQTVYPMVQSPAECDAQIKRMPMTSNVKRRGGPSSKSISAKRTSGVLRQRAP